MATVTALRISEPSPKTQKDNSMKYWTQDKDHLLMRDYIIGACSHFNYASPWMLGMGIMENGGPGNNWMQIAYGNAHTTFLSEFWSLYNKTGESAPTLDELKVVDALNAVISAFWVTQGSRGGNTNWEALGQLASAYNGWAGATHNSGITAYGWSTLFLAYGKNYTTISSYKYQGAQYSDKGSGLTSDLVTVYSTEPKPYKANQQIEVPTWTMTPRTLSTFSGGNTNNRQIILFAYTDIDYVSALNIILHFKRKNITYGGKITYPVATRDLTLAANNARNAGSCVIAVGNNAHLALKNQGLTAYSSFANLKRPGYIGFTSTNKAAYTDALGAAISANNGGF